MLKFNKKPRQLFFSLFLSFVFCLLPFAFSQDDAKAQNPSSSPAPQEKPKLSTLRGRVVYDDTGRPVRRSTVLLARQDGNSPGPSAITDNNGNFEFKNVPEGNYFIMVNAPGIVSPFSYIEDIAKLDRGQNYQLFETAKEEFGTVVVDKEEVKVDVRAKRGGAINGKVQYPDGDPAIGVRVSVFRKKKDGKLVQTLSNLSEAFFGAKTDDRGVYRIAGLPPGEYVISASEIVTHSDDERGGRDTVFEAMFSGITSFLNVFYPDATNSENATAINVGMGEEQNDINITLPERGLYKITGTAIARRDKRVLKGASVRIQKKDKTESLFSQMAELRINRAGTDEEGSWSFKELPDGVYTITIEPPYEYEKPMTPDDVDGEVRQSAPPKRRLSSKKQDVTINGGDVTNVVIELSDGATISGAVTFANGQPFPNGLFVKAEPLLSSSDTEETIGDTSKGAGYVQEGKFIIEALPPGPVQLSVEFYGNDKYYVRSIKAGSVDLLNSPLNIAEGADVRNVQVIIGDDAATLKGVVKSADGKPAIGASLVLIPADSSRWRARNLHKSFNFTITDTKGEFTITTAPGEYFIIFLRPGDNAASINPEWIKERSANAQRISLKPNDKQTVTLTVQ